MKDVAATILLVEDNEDDVFLMRRALAAASIVNPVFVAEDGQQALNYLRGDGQYADRASFPLPAVVFLDLKLPEIRGHDVLAWIREQPLIQNVPVVVLTSSNEPRDIKEAYRLGANSYLVKPPTADQLRDLIRAFKWGWVAYGPAAALNPASV